MKRGLYLFIAVVLLILAILAGVLVARAASDPCSVSPIAGPEWNHVWATVTCDTSLVTEEWVTYDFGDGGPTVDLYVTSSGTVDVEHDYPWPGGQFTIIVTRLTDGEFLGSLTLNLFPPTATPTPTQPAPTPTATSTQPSPTPTSTSLPPMNEVIYLPLIFRPMPDPVCSIEITDQVINSVTFNVTWSNAGTWHHTFVFGDGSQTMIFEGSNGSGQLTHDYPYPGESFTAKLLLNGGGSCEKTITIVWP